VLDIKDNANTQEDIMQLTPLETFVLHDLSTKKGMVKSETSNWKPITSIAASVATTDSLTSNGGDMTFAA
jgi:hypothetical protein